MSYYFIAYGIVSWHIISYHKTAGCWLGSWIGLPCIPRENRLRLNTCAWHATVRHDASVYASHLMSCYFIAYGIISYHIISYQKTAGYWRGSWIGSCIGLPCIPRGNRLGLNTCAWHATVRHNASVYASHLMSYYFIAYGIVSWHIISYHKTAGCWLDSTLSIRCIPRDILLGLLNCAWHATMRHDASIYASHLMSYCFIAYGIVSYHITS